MFNKAKRLFLNAIILNGHTSADPNPEYLPLSKPESQLGGAEPQNLLGWGRNIIFLQTAGLTIVWSYICATILSEQLYILSTQFEILSTKKCILHIIVVWIQTGKNTIAKAENRIPSIVQNWSYDRRQKSDFHACECCVYRFREQLLVLLLPSFATCFCVITLNYIKSPMCFCADNCCCRKTRALSNALMGKKKLNGQIRD